MATIASQASGNWSSTSTWVGGVLPSSSDIAQVVSGHEVVIDQDISVQGLSQTGSGKFIVTGSSSRSIECSSSLTLSTTATSTALLEFDGSYSADGTTISTASLSVGAHTGSTARAMIFFASGASGSASISSTGSWAGDTSTVGGYTPIVRTESSVDIDISADTITSTSSSSTAIYSDRTATGSITITASTLLNRVLSSYGDKDITINGEITGTESINILDNINPIVINGNISTAATLTSSCISISNVASLTVNGDVLVQAGSYGVNEGAYSYSCALRISRASSLFTTDCHIIVNGDILNNANNNNPGISGIVFYSSQPYIGTLDVYGDVKAGGVVSKHGIMVASMVSSISQGPNINIHGNVYGQGQSIATPTYAGAGSGIYINIDVYANINIYGNVYGGDYYGASGIRTNNSTSFADIHIHGGTIESSTVAPAIDFKSASGSLVVGVPGAITTIIGHPQTMGISGPFMVAENTYISIISKDSNENVISISTNAPSNLSPSDVRYGVIYDDGQVGTMHVPDPEDVAYGVPVDNTIGQAKLLASDVATVTGSQISTLGS